MSEQQRPEGYFTGVLDMYYAVMTQEDNAQSAPVYGAMKVLASTIEVTITPKYKEGKVNASNVVKRNERRVDSYDVKMNADKIPFAVRKELLGRAVDANGVQVIYGSQKAPYVAIAFAQTLDNDEQENWVMYKGKFAEGETVAHTEEDGAITYQHPTIEGTFVRRAYDNALAAIASTEDESVDESVFTHWFSQVYEPDAEEAETEPGENAGGGSSAAPGEAG